MSVPNRRYHHLLSRLKPFHRLDIVQQTSISVWKNAYQEHDNELRACLNDLTVPELEPYLAWIPSDKLQYFRQLAQGGFAKVFQAKIWIGPTNHEVAAKELKNAMVAEVRSPTKLRFVFLHNIINNIVHIRFIASVERLFEPQ